MSQELDVVLTDPMLIAVLELPRWTPAQTEMVAQAQRRSGLPATVFCRRLGIKVWRLYRWRRMHGKKLDIQTEAPEAALPEPFLPVRFMQPPGETERPCAEFVTPSGERLRVWASAPESWVRTLYQAMVEKGDAEP